MNTDIEKVFQLLLSCDEANHLLAKELIVSQNLHKYPLYRHQGIVVHSDMLECLRYIENKTNKNIFRQHLLCKMYRVANEMMEFLKYYNTDQASFTLGFRINQEKLQIVFNLSTLMTRGAIKHLEATWNRFYTEHQKAHSHYVLVVYSIGRHPKEYFAEDEEKAPYDWTQWVTVLKNTGGAPHFSSQPYGTQYRLFSAKIVLPCDVYPKW